MIPFSIDEFWKTSIKNKVETFLFRVQEPNNQKNQTMVMTLKGYEQV
jgi:hypothetical protein